MEKIKIYKIACIGNLAINLPFFLSIIYLFNYVDVNNKIPFLIGLFILGFFYWSYMATWYRKFSINRLKNKNEFFYWKKLSVYTLLLWPENFILTKTEFWEDESFQIYQKKVKKLA
ncbi:MAG: hypothetical protein H0X63_11790 [Flavobacteriales bacterium]|nr:hypothetical protein [Flavobacteriales bacterium]